MPEIKELNKIHNNLLFTVEDIALLLKQDYYDIDIKLLNLRAIEIYKIIHYTKWNEEYNNSKEINHRKNEDVELIGMIENQRLVEIDEDLRTILTPEQYQIFQMIKQNCTREFIEGWFNISNRTYYKIKHIIYNIIFKKLCYR